MSLSAAISIFAITTFLTLWFLSRRGTGRQRLERFAGPPPSAPPPSVRVPLKYRLSSMIYSKKHVRLLPAPVALIAMFVSLAVVRNLLIGTLWGASMYMIVHMLLSMLRSRQIERINTQLIDVVNSLIGSIKAGLSLPQAFQILAEESSLSISREFTGVVNRIQLGSTVEQALRWLSSRIPSSELNLVVSVLLIYQEIGGDLSYMLEKAVDALRYRIRLKREIRRATAQTRLSAVVGVAIPLVLAFFLYNLNPSFLVPLYTTKLGIILLSLGLAATVTGIMFIYKIIRSIEL
jgi:tight adherence protein B